MKMHVTKFMLVLTAVCLAFCQTGCGSGSDTIRSSSIGTAQSVTSSAPSKTIAPHTDVTVTDMAYVRPDLDALGAKIDDLQTSIDRKKPAEELISAYQEILTDYSHADSMLSLSYLLYAIDVTESYYQNEYAFLQSELGVLDSAMENVSIHLFESSGEAKTLCEQAFGVPYVENILVEEDLSDESIQGLLNEEEQQTLAYDELSATYTLLDNGRRWTLSEIESDPSLDYDEYVRLYNAYCAGFNEKAGAIFLDQVAIRSEMAQTLGYDDYAEYCYRYYGRDYTLADADVLHEAVKQYIVPVFIQANSSSNTYDLADAEFSEQDFIETLQYAAADFSPLLDESVRYMLDNKLYDFSVSANKMDGSFTTYISDYNAPFIFSWWTGDSTDITTVLHELGHFTNYYLNPAVGYSAFDSLDLAEIDSQALVLLMIDYYDEFYGSLAKEATQDVLIDAMFSLISGCMEDEFQQTVYQNPSMTLDEINACYKELAVEYGLDEVYGYTGTEWALISHTFQTPMYYISYAVSMVPALELYELAQDDPVGARTAYFNILQRAQYDPLQSVLEENGLSSVFSEATIKKVAILLEKRF
ncbi:MAG: M3 family metallopeptidase [Clostridiaceae bacterium]